MRVSGAGFARVGESSFNTVWTCGCCPPTLLHACKHTSERHVRAASVSRAGRSARPATGALQDGTLPQASGGGGSGSLSAESSAADLGLLSCGLFEDELEELLLSHSPKVSGSWRRLSAR